MTTPQPTASSPYGNNARPKHATIPKASTREGADSRAALEWLTDVAEHPGLSAEAKEVAAIMSGGWTGVGRRCRRGANWILEHSRLPDFEALRAASGELRQAGFITGHGGTASVWKLHDPATQLPIVETRRLESIEKERTRDLDAKLRNIRKGGVNA